LALINTNIPRENRGQAIGRWTAWTSVFFIIGPLVGGLILGITSWRWIFFINLPLIAFCLALALPSVTDSKDTNPRQIDFAGAGLAALALAGTTYGLIEGPTHHWTWPTVAAIIAGFLIAAIFVWYESRANDPMVKLSLFKSRNFTGSNLMTFAMYGAIAGFTFALTIYLQTKLHYSSLQAGLSLLPVSLTLWLFSGRVGRLSSIYGPRRFMTMGPIIAGIGIGLLYMLNPGDNYLLGVLPGALVFSAGLVLTVAPLTTTVMMSVDETSSGIASGINNAVARAAALIVVAALGLLGASQFYHFSMALCAALAILAGLISFAVIERVPATKPAPVKE
jgi:MFS family permease